MRKKANKCYIIHATDNILPDVTTTKIFDDYEKNPSDRMRCIYCLYLALSKRENYYQFNNPTAFGNPEYANYTGTVCDQIDDPLRNGSLCSLFTDRGSVLPKAQECSDLPTWQKKILSKKDRTK